LFLGEGICDAHVTACVWYTLMSIYKSSFLNIIHL
jgi:hypothetical protein